MKATQAITAVCVLGTLLCLGCAKSAKHAEKSAGGNASTEGALPDSIDFLEIARQAWEVTSGAPSKKQIASPRIAIIEFTTEYVQLESQEELADMSESIQIELAGVLYHQFVRALPEFAYDAVPLASVSDSAAYKKLKGTSLDDITPSFDAKGGLVCPVDGLLALEPGQIDGIRAVISELGVDGALQVRLRVGVYDGRVTMVKGSTFEAVTPDSTLVLTGARSLISMQKVLEQAADGAPTSVDSARFVKAIGRIFPPYIAMALVASGRGLPE